MTFDIQPNAPTILVVEDDADISNALRMRLEMHGFAVAQAFDAVVAMDVARQAQPDCVIMDVSMPGGDGFEVAQRLKEEPALASVPVIFLTASMRPDLPAKAMQSGAYAFLRKPFDSAELIAEIKRLTNDAYELS